MRADLLLVNGDPLTDIADTLNIDTVWRGGVELVEK
jgi:imidazolonepropionase-like amidohydrolase